MKRIKLIKHITKNGCYLLREGGNHSVYFNPGSGRISTIPRHQEIIPIVVYNAAENYKPYNGLCRYSY